MYTQVLLSMPEIEAAYATGGGGSVSEDVPLVEFVYVCIYLHTKSFEA